MEKQEKILVNWYHGKYCLYSNAHKIYIWKTFLFESKKEPTNSDPAKDNRSDKDCVSKSEGMLTLIIAMLLHYWVWKEESESLLKSQLRSHLDFLLVLSWTAQGVITSWLPPDNTRNVDYGTW